MGPTNPDRPRGTHSFLHTLLVAAALMVPTSGFATWDPLFHTFQTFPQGQSTSFGRIGYAAESATGDFNGDGRPDIAVSNRWDPAYPFANSVSVLLHQGSPLYSPMYLSCATVTVTGSDASPVNVAVADLNGDGKQDIVTGNYDNATSTPKSVSVIYGQGNGSFWKLRIKPLGNYQGGLNVRDLNNDGRADVACLVSTGGGNKGVAVMYATPDSLANAAIYGSSSGLSGFGIGDATADGIADLILTYPSSIVVLSGDNAGNFSPGLPSIPGPSVAGAAMAQMNGDAILDMVQFDRAAYNAIIRIGTGSGGYQAPVAVSMGAVPPFSVTPNLLAGDVDGDGDTDLIGYMNILGEVSVRKNNGAGSFGSATLFTDLPNAGVPTLVDTNQDSRPDIVAGDYVPTGEPNTVAVLLNDGSGGFQSSFKASNGAISVGALGDFNRDGKVDLASQVASAIDIAFGNGDGTFTFHNSVSTPTTPGGMVAADVNRDGKLDLLFDQLSNLAIYLGAGDGTFTPSQTLTGTIIGTTPSTKRCLADLNRDGRLDLVLPATSQLKVYIQQTDGTYGAPTTYTPSVGAYSVDFGDWNRDGRTDVAVAGQSGLLVYPGSTVTPGALAAEVVLASGTYYSDVCTLDANRDGMPDLAGRVAYGGSAGIHVFLGNGSGMFGAPTSFGTTSEVGWGIDSWDANRDGLADLVAKGHSGSDHVEVLLGGGNGLFGLRTSYGLGFTNGNSAFGDLNGDAMPDILAGTLSGPDVANLLTTLATPPTRPGTLRSANFYVTVNWPECVAVGDLNRDGKQDVVVGSNQSFPGVAVLMGNGAGSLSSSTVLAQSENANHVDVADFNRDGILDIVASNDGGIVTMLGAGDGTFGPKNYFALNAWNEFEVGDMDRNGIPDVVTASQDSIQILMGTGTGTFNAAVWAPTGTITYDLDLADLNRDGKLDVVAACGNVRIFYGGALGALDLPVTLAAPLSFCQSLCVIDVNKDGFLDIVASQFGTYYVIWGAASSPYTTWATSSLPFGVFDMVVGDPASNGVPAIFASRNVENLEILNISPSGTITQGGSYSIANTPTNLALADFDRDGLVDVVSSGAGGSLIAVNLHALPGTMTAVDTPAPAPTTPRVALRQNYPNPFNPRTTIRYSLARAERVQLRVFDVHGRLVATLRDDPEPAGEHTVEWDGRDREGQPIASGVYFYRLTTESGEVRSRRMVVMK